MASKRITYANFPKVDMEKLRSVCKEYYATIDEKGKYIMFNLSNENTIKFFEALDNCVSE